MPDHTLVHLGPCWQRQTFSESPVSEVSESFDALMHETGFGRKLQVFTTRTTNTWLADLNLLSTMQSNCSFRTILFEIDTRRKQTPKVVWWLLIASSSFTCLEFFVTSRTTISYPIFGFLTSPVGRFDDFYNNLPMPEVWYPSRAGFVLFPGSVSLYKALSAMGFSDLQAFIVFNAITYSLLFVSIFLTFRTAGVRLLILTSFPLFHSFWRANNETLLLSLYLFALWQHQKQARSSDSASGFFVGLHAITEANPFLFLALCPRRLDRLRTFIVSFLITTTSITVVFFLLSGVSPTHYAESLLGLIQSDADLDFMPLHNHSLVAGISGWIRVFTGEFPVLYNSRLAIFLVTLLPIISIAILLFLTIRQVTLQDGLICATALLLIVPTNSFTYRQVWLLVPLGLMLDKIKDSNLTNAERSQIGLIMLIIVPKTFILIKSPLNGLGHYESTLIDPFLCLALLVVTVKKRISDTHELHVVP